MILFYFLLTLIFIFSSLTLTLFYICFLFIHPTLTPGLTLLAVITLTGPHLARTFPVSIYVTGWLSFRRGFLTLEDGTVTFSRNVGKQLPHDAA
jgi:hypothetical protein